MPDRIGPTGPTGPCCTGPTGPSGEGSTGPTGAQGATGPGGGGVASGPPNAVAYYDGVGNNTGVAELIAGALDPFQRPQIHDFRLGPTLRGAVHRLGSWGQDGDPGNVISEGFVTYGANALGNGPDGAEGGMGFYEPNGFGAIQVIPGVNGGNPFYSCGFEDGGPMAPFGLDGFVVNDNNADPIAWIKRSDNTSTFRHLQIGTGAAKEGANAMQGLTPLGAGGLVVIPNTSVLANSRIMTTVQPGPAPLGNVYVSAIVPGVSFTISSTNAADLCNVAWQIWQVAP